MKIITISREFGSGGREFGKRLADALGVPCYDQQIIEMVAEKESLSKTYVANRSESIKQFYPATIAMGFKRPGYAVVPDTQIMASEQELIKKLAAEGSCVIVGRAADIVLKEEKPFRIFVCADDSSKLERCRAMAKGNEHLSDKDILRKCREIDKKRASYRKALTDKIWGDAAGYDLCVNTSGREIKALIPAVAAYINDWYFEEK